MTNDYPGSTSDEKLRAWLLDRMAGWLGASGTGMVCMAASDPTGFQRALDRFHTYVKTGQVEATESITGRMQTRITDPLHPSYIADTFLRDHRQG